MAKRFESFPDPFPVTEEVSQDPWDKVLFEVTVKSVIGKVTAGGQFSNPRVAAFVLIAEAGMVGEFSFPMEDGGVETVMVTQSPVTGE